MLIFDAYVAYHAAIITKITLLIRFRYAYD